MIPDVGRTVVVAHGAHLKSRIGVTLGIPVFLNKLSKKLTISS